MLSANFEKLRMELAAKHTQSVMEQELKQKRMLEERQQAFEEAFNNDLEIYKSLGTIPSEFYCIDFLSFSKK